jgi:hypothetical protein
MSLSGDLLLSISATLTHPWDFAFYQHNGEIANRIRAEFEQNGPPVLKEITIDPDNDIKVSTKMSSFYVNPSGVVSGGWLVFLKELQDTQQMEEYSRTIDLIFTTSASFAPESYSIRLLFRTTPENPLGLLSPRIVDAASKLILADKAPQEMTSFKTSMRFDQGRFSDTLDLEVSQKEVQLRYHRAGNRFISFQAFLQTANLNGLVENVESFIELLQSNEPPAGISKLFKR